MPNDSGFLRIGVTGGIGAGKSEVCAAFARKGRVVLAALPLVRGKPRMGCPVAGVRKYDPILPPVG